MMPLSPIIKKETEARSRSLSFPLMITGLNTLLFVVSLLGSFGIVMSMERSSEAMYGRFLRIYELTAFCEYILILLIAPLFTASSISGERETGTLDLLMTTYLTPANIIIEKITAAFISLSAAVMSGLPALLIPLMFGGVSIAGVIGLLVSFLPGVFLVLSVSIFASTACRTVTRSIAVSYAALIMMTAGFLVLPVFTRIFSSPGENRFAYILALDPLLPAASMLLSQAGEVRNIRLLFDFLRFEPDAAFLNHTALISIILQIAEGAGFAILAVLNITPARSGSKRILF